MTDPTPVAVGSPVRQPNDAAARAQERAGSINSPITLSAFATIHAPMNARVVAIAGLRILFSFNQPVAFVVLSLRRDQYYRLAPRISQTTDRQIKDFFDTFGGTAWQEHVDVLEPGDFFRTLAMALRQESMTLLVPTPAPRATGAPDARG